VVEGARLESDSGDSHRVMRKHSSRNQFKDFPPHDESRCEPVNVGVRRRFRPHLTQFLHSSQLHLLLYVTVFFGTLIETTCWGIDISVAH
jgi:hypothetical protein